MCFLVGFMCHVLDSQPQELACWLRVCSVAEDSCCQVLYNCSHAGQLGCSQSNLLVHCLHGRCFNSFPADSCSCGWCFSEVVYKLYQHFAPSSWTSYSCTSSWIRRWIEKPGEGSVCWMQHRGVLGLQPQEVKIWPAKNSASSCDPRLLLVQQFGASIKADHLIISRFCW